MRLRKCRRTHLGHNAAIGPVFTKRPRGSGYVRAGEGFYCPEHRIFAKDRGKRVKFLS